MLTMIDTNQALRLVIDNARPTATIDVPVAAALGATLGEEIIADRDYPPFDRSAMDGYAVRTSDAGRALPVTQEIAAGDASGIPLPEGETFAIMTGAPCPPGCEAVVKKEDVRVQGNSVVLPKDITVRQNITPRGHECLAGSLMIKPGTPATPWTLALLSTFGRQTVLVHRRPTLAIITTGSELVRPGEAVGPAQIRDSNAAMLSGMARCAGIEDIEVGHAQDTPEALAAALERTAGRDIVIFSGGVSAGRYDLVPEAMQRYGATLIFHKITQKPGKPLLFARKHDEQLLFGLPGTPLGSHLGFHRYVSAAIDVMMGRDAMRSRWQARLGSALSVRGFRQKFHLARARWVGNALQADSLWGRGSSDQFAVQNANAYLIFPGGEHSFPIGTAVDLEWIDLPPGGWR